MPIFSYRARNASGGLVEGTLDGAASGSVADILRGQGLIPVDIREAPGRTTKPAEHASAGFMRRIGHIDLLLFSRQMHTLLKAGVPIIRVLAGLQDAAVNPEMKRVIGEVRDSLESGRELSQALARHPRVFSPFYLSMVRVGEATGLLEEIFYRLFEHLEFERYMREQVKSALRYPLFVMLAMAAAMVIVNIWVIPRFAQVFASFGTELPMVTRWLLGFSAFMLEYWPHLLAGTIIALVAFRSWLGTAAGRYAWDRFSLRIPVAGKILHKAALSRFARSFALGMRSGVRRESTNSGSRWPSSPCWQACCSTAWVHHRCRSRTPPCSLRLLPCAANCSKGRRIGKCSEGRCRPRAIRSTGRGEHQPIIWARSMSCRSRAASGTSIHATMRWSIATGRAARHAFGWWAAAKKMMNAAQKVVGRPASSVASACAAWRIALRPETPEPAPFQEIPKP